MAVFVLQLNTDDGAAVFAIESFELLCDFAIELSRVFEIERVIAADLQGLCEKPIRKSSVAYFAMAERPESHDCIKTFFLAQLDEFSQVAPAVPSKLAFFFFVNIPEYIRRNNIESSCLALLQFVSPVFLRNAAVVDFAHYGNPRLAVAKEIVFVPRDLCGRSE